MPEFIFSNRTNWSLENNPLSLKLEQLKDQKIDVIDLTESNPTRCGFNYPLEWLTALCDQDNLKYMPLSKGMLETREAVAAYYAKRGLTVDPERLLLTSSTSEGYSFLFKLLTNPGDHVLIPRPSYPLFQFILELHDVTFDYYPLKYEDNCWRIDRKALSELITPQSRCVIVVNPNNPTGSYLGHDDLAFLNEICSKNQMSIISDEVFFDYSLNTKRPPESLITNTQAPSFVLSGISKILGLPQMKLSWIALNGPRSFVEPALERLEIIADTYLSVNTPVQNALISWLSETSKIQDQILKRVRANLEILQSKGFNVLSVEGGWYAVIEEARIKSEEQLILNLLSQDHVLIHPGYFFDFSKEGYLVISLLPESNRFQKGIEKLSQRMAF